MMRFRFSYERLRDQEKLSLYSGGGEFLMSTFGDVANNLLAAIATLSVALWSIWCFVEASSRGQRRHENRRSQCGRDGFACDTSGDNS